MVTLITPRPSPDRAVILAFNQSKDPFIKLADLARYDYQFLVLARKLSLPIMRRQRVFAAGPTQLVLPLYCPALVRKDFWSRYWIISYFSYLT